MDEKRLLERSAPWFSIPSRQIVSVEHPCLIKNVDKGIETLQGNSGISKLLNPPRADTSATLSLRPEDVMSRPLVSTSTPTNNVLLRVIVPKKTGRKRKRGSSDDFTEAPTTDPAPNSRAQDASHLLRSLQDNVGKYRVEAVGTVDRTHMFRGMPDFVFSTAKSPFLTRVREKVLPFEYGKLKEFHLDMSKGALSNVDIIPPPALSYNDVPFNYTYRQNATVKQSVDQTGKMRTVNTQRILKVRTHLVPCDAAVVPSEPRDDCPPLESLDRIMQETVAVLIKLFLDRPAWTRRALRNCLTSGDQKYVLRHALAYAGYAFRSGPWRDAVIKFGHDPRTSPENRIYQTLMFQILPREGEFDGTNHGRRTNFSALSGPNSTATPPSTPQPTTDTETPTQNTPQTHLFTGQLPLPRDGKMWMICDITDPLLCQILQPTTVPPPSADTLDPIPPPNPLPLRPVCDIVADGWYGCGTLAKAKAIMRSKIHTLVADKTPQDSDFIRLLEFPDFVTSDEDLKDVFLDPGVSSRELQLAADIRGDIRAAIRATPSKPSKGSKVRRGDDGEGERHDAGEEDGEKRVRWEDGGGEGGGDDDEEEHDYDEQDKFDDEGIVRDENEGADGDRDDEEDDNEDGVQDEDEDEIDVNDDGDDDDAMDLAS